MATSIKSKINTLKSRPAPGEKIAKKLLLEVDFHFEIDTVGSRERTSK
jgi:hypothetical protein